MPYNPDLAFGGPDESTRSGQPGSSQPNKTARQTPTADPARKRDEPKGIARYFQVEARDPNLQQGYVPLYRLTPVPVPSRPPPPATAPARVPSHGSPPATPTLARTPTRIAVVLQSSQHRQSPESLSREESQDSLADIITSDINPPRRQGPESTTIPGSAPTSAKKPHPTTEPATTPLPHHPSPPTTLQTPATAPKRRGRPLGWRPGMGSYAGRTTFPGGPPASTTKKPASGPPKKRGRPPGRPAVHPARAIWAKVNPAYIPFLCEWKGCPAELQNADTLRRHVRRVHGRERACLWGKCAGREVRFEGREEMERHVEDVHLIPLVWWVGDGPRNTCPTPGTVDGEGEGKGVDGLPGYLFDKEGRQVTPSVLGQGIETDEERKERKRRLKRLIMERDRNAPFEEEEEGVALEMSG